ncbi:MAG: HepT-like ribonuclease domain-containing protein [Tepidisphaeraceae bacterium]|jgi:uncharacterized protein with HEPN domain
MPPETAKLLFDMKRAVERIGRFAQGKTLTEYVADELLRSGIERQFEIIGEAMTRLIKRDLAAAEKISEYRRIAAFRNVLIHGYDSIDDETSWGIIEKKLPTLRAELENLLPESPE